MHVHFYRNRKWASSNFIYKILSSWLTSRVSEYHNDLTLLHHFLLNFISQIKQLHSWIPRFLHRSWLKSRSNQLPIWRQILWSNHTTPSRFLVFDANFKLLYSKGISRWSGVWRNVWIYWRKWVSPSQQVFYNFWCSIFVFDNHRCIYCRHTSSSSIM